MTIYQRAAQFAPFAALTGHSAAICEAARLTDKKKELSENECETLNQRIMLLLAHFNEHPYVSITYFIPGTHKEVGQYATHTGTIRSWDEHEQRPTFDDGAQIKANVIIDIKRGIIHVNAPFLAMAKSEQAQPLLIWLNEDVRQRNIMKDHCRLRLNHTIHL